MVLLVGPLPTASCARLCCAYDATRYVCYISGGVVWIGLTRIYVSSWKKDPGFGDTTTNMVRTHHTQDTHTTTMVKDTTHSHTPACCHLQEEVVCAEGTLGLELGVEVRRLFFFRHTDEAW